MISDREEYAIEDDGAFREVVAKGVPEVVEEAGRGLLGEGVPEKDAAVSLLHQNTGQQIVQNLFVRLGLPELDQLCPLQRLPYICCPLDRDRTRVDDPRREPDLVLLLSQHV